MPDASVSCPIDLLEELIEEERAALLRGNLDRLARLLERKEHLLALLSATEPAEPAAIARVKSGLARNQTLLESAMSGIRSVHDRLQLLQEAKAALRTYDRTGRERRFEPGSGRKVERRA